MKLRVTASGLQNQRTNQLNSQISPNLSSEKNCFIPKTLHSIYWWAGYLIVADYYDCASNLSNIQLHKNMILVNSVGCKLCV